MKNIIKKLLRESLSTHDLDSMFHELNEITNCDCCNYFDMNSIDNYGGFDKPIYYLINKREIHQLEYINPKQYIYVIARGFGLTYDDAMGYAYNDDKANKYAEMMKSGSKAPIGYYVDGKSDQEGRHRASAAMKLGCNYIPVVKIEKDLNSNYVDTIVRELVGLSREEVNAIYKNKGYNGISDLDWRELNNYIKYRLNEKYN